MLAFRNDTLMKTQDTQHTMVIKLWINMAMTTLGLYEFVVGHDWNQLLGRDPSRKLISLGCEIWRHIIIDIYQ